MKPRDLMPTGHHVTCVCSIIWAKNKGISYILYYYSKLAYLYKLPHQTSQSFPRSKFDIEDEYAKDKNDDNSNQVSH